MHPCNSDVAPDTQGSPPACATRWPTQSFKLSSPPTMSTPKRSRIWHGAWLPGFPPRTHARSESP